MTTYCTIEEAYKVPSFDTPARKKRMAPGAGASCPAGPGLLSSAGTVAHNPYGGERAAFAAPPGAPGVPQNLYGLLEYNEGFANMQQQTETSYAGAAQDYDYMCRAYNICGPQAVAPGTKRVTKNPPPAFQAPAGAPPALVVPPAPSGQPAGSQYLQEYFSYTATRPASAHQTAPGPAFEGFAAPPPAPSSTSACPPVTAQAYVYPVPPEARAQAAAAMQASLQQTQGGTPSGAPSRNTIQGIYDEDLEQYLSATGAAPASGTYVPFSPGVAATTPLSVQTVLNAPKVAGPPPASPTLSTTSLPPAPRSPAPPAPAPKPQTLSGADPAAPAGAPAADSPAGAAMARFWNTSASQNPAAAAAFQDSPSAPFGVSELTPAHPVLTSPAKPAPSSRAVWWDLLLFALVGLLLILLLEQLFRIAMMTGMKRTMEVIGPYLRQVE